MKRLVTFGCSYTYGHGLQDCCTTDGHAGPVHSNLAWPSIIAERLDIELSNQSKPGCSNLEIVNRIKNFKFQKDDICIVHWTFIERWCKILDLVTEIGYENIGPWDTGTNKTAKAFYGRIYNDATGIFLSKMYADFTGYYLKDLGIKYISFAPIIYHKIRNTLELKYTTPQDYENLCHFHDKKLYPSADDALDNAHPGPKTHTVFAEYILEEYPWLKD